MLQNELYYYKILQATLNEINQMVKKNKSISVEE